MRIGRCPSCARPYTAGEVTGLGILRARPESEGGPIMEFACPGCQRRMPLVPHGHGRYARPGEPPPPPVPVAQRSPPWAGKGRRRRAPDPPPDEEEEVERIRIDVEDLPPPREEATAPPPASRAEAPLTRQAAFGILDVESGASREEIERAYRARSRTCHPDKVAHLDPEFQALAEQKFRRLHDAYELLLRS